MNLFADPHPASRPARWAVANWSVRWKVVAIALAPMVLVVVFASLRIAGARADAHAMRLAADRAQLVPALTGYLSALDKVLLAASADGDVPGAQRRYQDRRRDLQSRLVNPDVVDDVRSGLTALTEAAQGLVDQVVSEGIGVREQVTGYAPILLTAEDAINGSVRVDDERIRTRAEALSRAVGARGQMLMAELLLNRGGELPDPELRTSMITLAGTEPSTLFAMNQVLGADSREAKTLQQQLVTRMAIMSDPEAVLPDNPALRESIHSTDLIAARLIEDTTRSVTTALVGQAADRRAAALRDTVLLLAAIAAAVAAVWLVARSLVRPLRTLRDGALQVAHTDLENEIARVRAGDAGVDRDPPPLAVHTTEEIGQVAHAVDELHARALLLAGDEARLRLLVNEMFETMSRRSRSLIDQQLVLIDALERDERDPQRLDHLFRLDHLAVRMRRNSANLLLLAGARGGPDRGGDVGLSTVLGAAVCEVEDYRRVHTAALPAVAVRGAAVADITHLIAELIDNALRYSPPTAPVRLAAVATADAGLQIEIVDSGLGMTDADLRMANMRLATGDQLTPEKARHMGLFVVGQLAQRHGIKVRLARVQGCGPGITAQVYLTRDLLSVDGAVEPAEPAIPAPLLADTEAPPASHPGMHPGVRPGLLPRRTPGSSGISEPAGEPAAVQDDPIYQRMLSEWLVDLHELGRSADLDWKSVWDHGWTTAAKVENMPVSGHTEHGLPVREPGARLVPGSAVNRAGELPGGRAARHRAAPDRDPAAVRASIGSHFEGVRAGRSHARSADPDPRRGRDSQ